MAARMRALRNDEPVIYSVDAAGIELITPLQRALALQCETSTTRIGRDAVTSTRARAKTDIDVRRRRPPSPYASRSGHGRRRLDRFQLYARVHSSTYAHVPWHRRSRPVDDMPPRPIRPSCRARPRRKLHNLARWVENLALGASSGDRRKRITREARPRTNSTLENGRRDNVNSVEETCASTDNREQIAPSASRHRRVVRLLRNSEGDTRGGKEGEKERRQGRALPDPYGSRYNGGAGRRPGRKRCTLPPAPELSPVIPRRPAKRVADADKISRRRAAQGHFVGIHPSQRRRSKGQRSSKSQQEEDRPSLLERSEKES